ncbi:hypothetical protein OCU04_001295 [Sclerotinia nivalis]|uniref:Uncharacterized protein n=1 Tax=Sclerotinia nivalis TaxID=352851 RepID=A0A9X0DR02_9HELO|nr:hypothetical protein OCU04_001295 [Sclerotinia nivalis]
MLTGSPSTKEVFLVVQSTCYKFRAGQMPNTVTFRPVLQKSCNDSIKHMPEMNGQWTDGKGPDFKFVSLAPSLKDGKGKELKHDGTIIHIEDAVKFTRFGKKFPADLKLKTGVDVNFKTYRSSLIVPCWDNHDCEIGLFNGTDEGIEKCKEEIKARCAVPFDPDILMEARKAGWFDKKN